MTAKVVLVMGSKGDLSHAQAITKTLQALDIPSVMRVCSAHKATARLLTLLNEYEESGPLVYIAIAGRANALGAVMDANTRHPVISCPPYSDRFGGGDIYSSLRLPSGIATPTIMEPDGAALLAAKILAMSDRELDARLSAYRQRFAADLLKADEEVQKL
ncbi:MAG TPA: AIR carboxylase family protein [Ktedonobacteraceae bacterium]|nr:AIR carboxylase family protein [Ktedonobacteraceae bacterium]